MRFMLWTILDNSQESNIVFAVFILTQHDFSKMSPDIDDS